MGVGLVIPGGVLRLGHRTHLLTGRTLPTHLTLGNLAQTLKREPRDVGALAGLGAIMLESGKPDDALKAYDRALALAPAYEPLTEARARAKTMLWSLTP